MVDPERFADDACEPTVARSTRSMAGTVARATFIARDIAEQWLPAGHYWPDAPNRTTVVFDTRKSVTF